MTCSRKERTEEGREAMLRCRKEGLVCGFISRARGRAWVVRWVERREAMVGRFVCRLGMVGAGREVEVEERRERVRRMISSVREAGRGMSAAGVECRDDDVLELGGAGSVSGSSESAVRRMRARVAFRRRSLSCCHSVSRGL